MREAFENWALKKRYLIDEPESTAVDAVGEYVDMELQFMWEAWQASRKAALEEAAQFCESNQVGRHMSAGLVFTPTVCDKGKHEGMAYAEAIRDLSE